MSPSVMVDSLPARGQRNAKPGDATLRMSSVVLFQNNQSFQSSPSFLEMLGLGQPPKAYTKHHRSSGHSQTPSVRAPNRLFHPSPRGARSSPLRHTLIKPRKISDPISTKTKSDASLPLGGPNKLRRRPRTVYSQSVVFPSGQLESTSFEDDDSEEEEREEGEGIPPSATRLLHEVEVTCPFSAGPSKPLASPPLGFYDRGLTNSDIMNPFQFRAPLHEPREKSTMRQRLRSFLRI